jgi:hypothetical protein
LPVVFSVAVVESVKDLSKREKERKAIFSRTKELVARRSAV